MSTALNAMIQEVVAQAARNPVEAREVLARGSQRFRKLAADPRNARVAASLVQAAAMFDESVESLPVGTTTDFQHLLNAAAAAYDQEGGDEMAALAARVNLLEDGESAQRVRNTPPSIDAEAVLGRVTSVKWNPTSEEERNYVRQSDTVIFWQGQKNESQALTVDIGFDMSVDSTVTPDAPAFVDPNVVPRPYADIVYGSDGFKDSVRIDVGIGTRFTIPANYVSVLVGMQKPPAGKESGVMRIGGNLGFFGCTSVAPITRTIYLDDIPSVGSGSKVYFERPKKSIVMLTPQCALSSTSLGGTAVIQIFDAAGNVLSRISFQNSSNIAISPISLSNDARYFSLENTSDTSANFRISFQLAL